MRDAFPDLHELAGWLGRQPPLPLTDTAAPLVYGYVRTPEPQPSYADACADLLTWWSVTRGWRLGVVFRDVGVGCSQSVRPGFTGLLDVLRLPEAAFALVVSRDQLARKPEEATRLGAKIRRTSCHLRVLADEVTA
ncbi:recombinase family protein [Amycolatopsis azurea]|uniref:recombinase family protein n=1 Tax=Amycolatopsis azurea TaxID=36819 RepID=UPI003819F3B8